jgi:hypothetical protein
VLCEIARQRTDLTRMVTAGLDEDTIDTLTGTLLRMKTILIQEAHAVRRGGDAHAAANAHGDALSHAETEAAHTVAETTELA